ncbi:glycosyltransferase [Ignavibacterium sp.]|uniref:glycosyltransferase n=1 Tax=Ignavibacterium sp. TaxID=2651167 RepID=UPI00307E921B
MIENILLVIFLFLLIHYLFFLIKIYFGLNKLSVKTNEQIVDEYVSVLIPFRNEEKFILRILNSLESQNYPEDKFEVIFIDDNSIDNSKSILEKNIKKKNFRVISVPNDYSRKAHKKRAIRYGIENSKGEIIVTTDADCVHPKSWLKSLLSFMDKETGFVSGPVEFFSSNKFFEQLQKLEFAGLVITGAGLIGSNSPIICNAANIVYRRKAFDEVGGFSFQMNLSSGDDELLMQKIFRDTDYKISFALDKDAIVKTESNSSLKQFYNQRKRWASKGLFYKNKFLILKLILIYLFYLSFIILPVLGFLLGKIFFLIFALSLTTKIIFEFILLKKGFELLSNKESLKLFLVAEIFHIPYIIIAGLSGAFGNYQWKGRTISR